MMSMVLITKPIRNRKRNRRRKNNKKSKLERDSKMENRCLARRKRKIRKRYTELFRLMKSKTAKK